MRRKKNRAGSQSDRNLIRAWIATWTGQRSSLVGGGEINTGEVGIAQAEGGGS
jgi:hypothetical protein